MTSTTEPDLAARFACEVEPLLDMLARGARRLARSDTDAEDLLQDALLHAFAGYRTFREGSNLKAWLFRILYNRWVSAHRCRQRRPDEVFAEDVAERDLVQRAVHRSAEAEVLEAWPDDDIRAAVAGLPEVFATAVYYSEVAGYTFAETAELMNTPVGTAMSRVSRGRQRLRAALAPVDESDRRIA